MDCVVSEVRDSDFATKVCEGSGLVLVDFWAPWCGPCVAFAPQLEKLAQKYRAEMKVYKLNVQECQETPIKYSISAVPTMLLFRDGLEISRLVGADMGKLLGIIDASLT